METIFALLLVALTSAATYQIVRYDCGSIRTALADALRSLVECVGAFIIFFFLNVAVGAAVILLFRGFTPRFVPLYELENLPLLVLSAVQAFVFQRCWMADRLNREH